MPLFLAFALALTMSPARPDVRHATSGVAAVTVADSTDPREAARVFLYALYANDSAAFRRAIVPEPGSEVMLGADRISPAGLTRLRAEVAAVRLSTGAPLAYEGAPARPNADGTYPIGTRGTLVTGFRGTPMVVPVVRTDDGWKVDVRFWLAMIREARSQPDESSPELRAKAFLCYSLANQPEELAPLSATPIDARALMKGYDLRAGDLDQVLSLCGEMPVVRARPGETVRVGASLVTARDGGDTLVLIGLMGQVEVPFLLRRVSGEWKVAPQPYFQMLRAAKAI